MTTIAIITIVVVALLTVIIFGLTWLAYVSCLKAYRIEVDQGKHDEIILKNYHAKKKRKIGELLGLIGSYTVLSALSALFIVGIIYKASGENFSFNNEVSLVIKSGSMSEFYNEDLANKYKEYNYNLSLQFDVGDICIFEKTSNNTELVEGEVYGYKYKNVIITHRLIKVCGEKYQFRGDNNPCSDGLLVSRDDIIYHYVGRKVPGIGSFILYAQSYFGIWSLVGIVGVAISSEIVYQKINKINKERDKIIYIPEMQPESEPAKDEGETKNEK